AQRRVATLLVAIEDRGQRAHERFEVAERALAGARIPQRRKVAAIEHRQRARRRQRDELVAIGLLEQDDPAEWHRAVLGEAAFARPRRAADEPAARRRTHHGALVA